MRNLYLLAFMVSTLVVTAQKQTPTPYNPPQRKAEIFKYQQGASSANNGSSRASTIRFTMDNGKLDENYNNFGPNQGAGYFYQDDATSFVSINKSISDDSTGVAKWAFTWYPRIIDMDNEPNWPHNEYSPNRVQLTIDTIFMNLGHLHFSGVDTIVISVFDKDDLATINLDSGATGTMYGQIVVVTDTSLLGGDGGGGQPGTFLLAQRYPFVPDAPIVIPRGKRFLVNVYLKGPGGNSLILGSSRRNDCGTNPTCGGSIPYVNDDFNQNLQNFNSIYISRFRDNDGPYLAFPQFFYLDCNQSGAKDSVCEELPTQNLDIFPSVTANVPDFFVDVTAEAGNICPGSTVTLTEVHEGAVPPYTVNWQAKGSLSSTADKQVQLTMRNTLQNDTVIVTVTDANNLTAIDTFIVRNNGIGIVVSNSQPITVQCNSNVTITTSISGTTTGRRYEWSTGQSGPAQATITVENAAEYTVTVRNNFGCSAVATATVVYPGVTNTVNFQASTPARTNCPVTFTNNSTYRNSPWETIWNMGNGDIIAGNPNTFVYTYGSPGVYSVTLTMDSAGCSFSKSINVTVSSGTCVGIEEVDESAVNIYPNPTTSQLFITMDGLTAFQPQWIAIYDINGRKVQEQRFASQISLSTLTNGIYFLEVKGEGKVARKRVVKAND